MTTGPLPNSNVWSILFNSRHRYRAADKPMLYMIDWKFVNPTWSALKSLFISFIVGLVFVIPLFFELTFERKSHLQMENINETHVLLVSQFLKRSLSMQEITAVNSGNGLCQF